MSQLTVIEQINKKYGSNSAYYLGSDAILSIPVISTQCLSLDMALGVGGIPKGRITEIYGPESSGKTTLCQHIIAETQKLGGVAAFIDVEHALDPQWLKTTGVDIEQLIMSQPDTGEMALNLVEMYVRSKEVDLVVLDSIAALAPKAELSGEMGDSHMALVARLMSQAMRKLTAAIQESNCAVIFTNQLRSNIGVMFGPTETTTGGNALKYYASVRLDIRRSTPIKRGDETVGNKVKVTVRKNKVAPPFKVTEFDIYYDEGLSLVSEIIKFGIEQGFIDKRGSWYFLTVNNEEIKVQGEVGVRSIFNSDHTLRLNMLNQIRHNLGMPICIN